MKRSFRGCAAFFLLAAVVLSQVGGDLAPRSNLVIEGIPQIPFCLAREVYQYFSFRSTERVAWHPVRRAMLVRTYGERLAPRQPYGTNRGQLYLVEYPGGPRRQLTFFRDPIYTVTWHPKKADYFVFSKDRNGDELCQLYRCDIASGRVTLLTDGKAQNFLGAWSHAGNRMAYLSRRNGKDLDLYVIDPARPESAHLRAPLGQGWSVQSWSPDDRRLLLVQYVSAGESYLWLLDVATGRKTLLTPRRRTESVNYGSSLISYDGKGIYTLTDQGSEFYRLAYIDLATMRPTFLTRRIPWDVTGFVRSDKDRTIAFVTNEDGISVLHLLDTRTRKERPAPRLPIGVLWGLGWHANGYELGFTMETSHFPADAYSLDIRTGTVDRWTESRTPGLPFESFAEAELIHWRSFDGRTISGFLYRPPARFTGRRPVIIDIHGGPESQSRPQCLRSRSYYVNKLGIALIFPNVRGSARYGKTFLKLDDGFRRVDAYRDIGALLDWIKTRPDLDPDRVMVTGGSYGGHMALAVATMDNDRIRCVLDRFGPSNLVTFLEGMKHGQELSRSEYGDEGDPKMRAFLERIAPVNNAWKVTKPLFIVQGDNDPRVPLGEAEQMVAALRRTGTPVWYLLARNEGHGFSKGDDVNYLYYATALFVQEYLLE